VWWWPGACEGTEGRVEVTPHPEVPTLLVVRWADPAEVVEVEVAQGDWSRTVSFRGADGEGVVVGARAGAPVTWSARGDGARWGRGTTPLALPPDTPTWRVSVPDAARSVLAGGSIDLVTSTFADDGRSWVQVLDGHGGVRWSYAPDDGRRVIRVRVGRDGRSLLWGSLEHPGTNGLVTRRSLDGELRSTTAVEAFHHDFLELPDGRLAWLSFVFADADLGSGAVPIATDAVRLGAEGGTEAELWWSFLDDYPVEPWYGCRHMDRGWLLPGKWEWTHANSLGFDGRTLFVNARHIDALVGIDWQTARMRWQIGGPDATLAWDDPSDGFSHPHLSDLGDGRALVFDNAVHTGLRSRILSLAWDEGAGTVASDWVYPLGEPIEFLGDAKRLPGGNVLVSWGPGGRLTEVTPDGSTVWEAEAEGVDGIVVARTELLEDWR
jgi:hypothetical protein